MGNSYVDGKVREAVLAAKGSRTTAQRLLMAWAVEDPELLLGIAQPFLKAISAAAIERAVRPAGGGARSARPEAAGGRSPAGPAPRPGSALSKEALASVLGRLGRDPEDVPEGRPAAARAGGPGPIRAATAVVRASDGAPGGVTHEKAMLAIAKAFVAKKVR